MVLLSAVVLWFTALDVAQASGPVERMVQLLAHPTDANVLVVRYGAASQGLLFSKDGGKNFALMCSNAIAPELKGKDEIREISTRSVSTTAASVLDGTGQISIGYYGALWTGDGSGCTWTKLPAFDGKWPYSIKVDPIDPKIVWAAVSTSMGSGEQTTNRLELMKRDAAGTWMSVGQLMNLPAGRVVLEGDLLVAANGSGRRFYGSVRVAGAMQYSQTFLVSSDDGVAWNETALPAEQYDLALLTVDPANPDRVLAAVVEDGTDQLLLSEDRGKTFKLYAEMRAVSDVTFDAQGRVFIADIGDNANDNAKGGLFTAAKLGDPLTHVGATEYVDCVHFHKQTGKLYMCNRQRFGTVDTATGVLENVIEIGKVSKFLECPGRDLRAECADQLNSGPSWCCTGHYPWTPICDGYNVTRRPDGFRVFCGIAGREYGNDRDGGSAGDGGMPFDATVGDGSGSDADMSIDADGEGPDHDYDHPDAEHAKPTTRKRGNGGCSLASENDGQLGLIASLSVLVTIGVRRRRRMRAEAL